jgi:phosphoribosylformylglycinamidine synthase subunit PurQ / glutaminase
MRGRKPRVCIIVGLGINADAELGQAFRMAGAAASSVHVKDLIAQPGLLASFEILAFPGGFSFGDHLGSGKVFATLFRRNLGSAMNGFAARGGLVIGVCNGFQVLAKMGALPNLSGSASQEASLIHNDSGLFEDRWVRVRFEGRSRCVWTRGISEMDLPVRHGEGKFIVRSAQVLGLLESDGLIALRYASPRGGPPVYPEDPNGSDGHVAGICDPSGRVFGLMPHPEAFIHPQNHPEWTSGSIARGEGLLIFANGVRAAREAS